MSSIDPAGSGLSVGLSLDAASLERLSATPKSDAADARALLQFDDWPARGAATAPGLNATGTANVTELANDVTRFLVA